MGKYILKYIYIKAYINKERAAQVAEKNLQRKEEESAKARAHEELMEEKKYLEDLEKRELIDDQLSKLRCLIHNGIFQFFILCFLFQISKAAG